MNNLFSGESRYIEYKQSYSKTFLKTVSAFANYHDGSVVFGIDDNGQIVGVTNLEELKLSVEQSINDAIEPVPYYELESVVKNDYEILLVKVYEGEHKPYMYSGKAYRRNDTSSVQVDRVALTELALTGRNLSYDELVSQEQSFTFNTLRAYLLKEMDVSLITDELLKSLRLKKKDDYTNAAMLLADYSGISHSVVNMIAYEDDSVARIIDKNIQERVSVLIQYGECLQFYRKHINVGAKIEGAYRVDIEDIPFVAYREAIANAIVHRDYAREVAIRVEVFSDRIEIVSPGTLPVGLSVEEYQDGNVSIIRNPIIADLFHRLNIIERFGTGIRRIKKLYSNTAHTPEFKVYENSVKVILPKLSVEPVENRLNDVGLSVGLTEREKLVLQYIRTQGPSPRKSIEEQLNLKRSQSGDILKSMRKKGIVAMVGAGKNVKYIER